MLVDKETLIDILSELSGQEMVVGLDEVGRGPLVGDVVSAAVSISIGDELSESADSDWMEITDSKKLSEKRREQLAGMIRQEAVWGVGRASSQEIDKINILQASLLSMERAYYELIEKLDQQGRARPVIAVIDGRHAPKLDIPTYVVVKGDLYVRAVSAASILAKVTRDREMVEFDQQYPGYGIAKHKGYPTRQHLEALRELGPTPEHRRSFAPVRKVLEVG